MKARSYEMVLVGYFLARWGRAVADGKPLPPAQLGTDNWKIGYATFHQSLGGGRPLSAFANSLKNVRDSFDSHLQTGRVGWRQGRAGAKEHADPQPLTGLARRVFDDWASAEEDQLWAKVKPYAQAGVSAVDPVIIRDLYAEPDPEKPLETVRTEGGVKVVVSTRRERNPVLRDVAIRLHGTRCAACGFDFGVFYGDWGEGYIEVHHLQQLADAGGLVETDAATDLSVLCANCHRMAHRKKGVSLTVEELRAKISSAAI